MSKIKKDRNRESSKLYRQANMKKLKIAGYLSMALAPTLISFGMMGGTFAVDAYFNNQIKDAQAEYYDIIVETKNDSEFLATKEFDKSQLEQFFADGRISKAMYAESKEYLNSDDYVEDYLKFYANSYYQDIAENQNAIDENQRKIIATWGASTILSTFSIGGQLWFYIKGIVGDNVKEAQRALKEYRYLKSMADGQKELEEKLMKQ